MTPAKVMLALAAFGVVSGDARAAGRAKSPTEATVFIRLIGNVHIEVQEFGITTTADRERVEVGTGSGFVISPYGYIVTNAHVIGGGDIVSTDGPRTAKATVKVSTIEVCFPAAASDARGAASRCSEASVYATDPTLDLAVLFVNGAALPYLALGDSDAVGTGQPISALGYPFGRRLEVGQAATTPGVVPDVSMTTGTVSAMRAGNAGERRYLQISSPVNPGNSGGPVVDRDGFAIGVIRMGVRDATAIAFAIPINLVKDFLESHGVDQTMPTHRIRLGPFQTMEGKGVGLRLPEGWADTSRFRSHVEANSNSPSIALRVDRVLSPWNGRQIEQALLGSQSFERFLATANESETSARADEARVLTGRAVGASSDSGEEMRMDYAILDVGGEQLVARYIGPAQEIAYNAAVLRESLTGLEAQKIVSGTLEPVENLQWVAAPATDGTTRVPLPSGWSADPGAPSSCPRLPQPSAAISASAPRDFSVALRAAVWSAADFTPEQGASMCSTRRAAAGSASYASRGEWLGVSYSVEGVFVRLGPRQVIQLEVIAPDQKAAFARPLLAAWIKVVSSGPTP